MRIDQRRLFLHIFVVVLLVLMASLHILAIQKFSETPQYTEVNPGENALLKCRVYDKKGTCSWQKDNKPVGNYAGKYEWANEDSPTGGDCSLWVRSSTLQLDDGQWQCQVTASTYAALDALSSAPATLAVRVPPHTPRLLYNGSVLMPGENITVQAGTRATIVCEARYGNPPAAISWYIDDERLTAWSQSNVSEVERPRVWAARSVLELGASRSVHARTLACRAHHAAYSTPHYKEAYASLDVTFVPVVSIRGADVESGLTSLEEGVSVVALECESEGNPLPHVWWTKDGQLRQLTHATTSANKLILAPILRNHSGIYACQARNSLGSSDSMRVDIDVKYSPRVTWVGPDIVVEANLFSKVVLECRAEGNPKPKYQWLHSPGSAMNKDKLPTGYVVSNDPQYIIHNVTYRQQGQYICIAVNHIGLKERSHQADPLTLNVMGPPAPLGGGEEAEGGSQGWLGRDAAVETVVCAEPPPRKATWLWGSLTLNVPSQIGRYRSIEPTNVNGCYHYSLVIRETIHQDARGYILRVENERGSTTHAVTLTLHETARIAPLIGAILVIAALLVIIVCLLRRCRQTKAVQYKSSDLESEKDAEGEAEGEAIPADAIYSVKPYSPDALQGAYSALERDALENVYSVLEPQIHYEITIMKDNAPPTRLSLSKPITNNNRKQNEISRRGGYHTRTSKRQKQRPKSLQTFDNLQYLDHVFPKAVEI